MVDVEYSEPGLFPQTVGEQLRDAREAGGQDLNDIAVRTRIPIRHLEAIERSEYSALPSQTYAIGFARAYGRAIGLDDGALARQLRAELGRSEPGESQSVPYEPMDPARIPPRYLAWTVVALAIVIAIVYGTWRSEWLDDEPASRPRVAANEQAAQPAGTAAAPAPVPTSGKVVLTATSEVWIRINDKDKKRLFEKQLAVGEAYEVPADTNGPTIMTGRPEALKVTVNGQQVAPLGPPARTINSLGISAAALAARPAPMIPASAAPMPAPANSNEGL